MKERLLVLAPILGGWLLACGGTEAPPPSTDVPTCATMCKNLVEIGPCESDSVFTDVEQCQVRCRSHEHANADLACGTKATSCAAWNDCGNLL